MRHSAGPCPDTEQTGGRLRRGAQAGPPGGAPGNSCLSDCDCVQAGGSANYLQQQGFANPEANWLEQYHNSVFYYSCILYYLIAFFPQVNLKYPCYEKPVMATIY